jgi:Tfp pilus assembly protein PilZ
MTGSISLLSREEIKDILEAAEATLVYATKEACLPGADCDPSKTVENAVTLSLQSVRAALSIESSPISVKAHATNATGKLRTALAVLQDASDAEKTLRTSAAVARALSLLYQLTKVEDVKAVQLRKKKAPVDRHRDRKTASRRRRPTLHVAVDAETANFFCDLNMDIASGGLFVLTADLIPVGSKVNLVATLPDQRVIMGGAQVAFVRAKSDLAPTISSGMGLILTRLTTTARAQINEYMLNNVPMLLKLKSVHSGSNP